MAIPDRRLEPFVYKVVYLVPKARDFKARNLELSRCNSGADGIVRMEENLGVRI